MNNKGFTLIELLAVMVILIGISSISVVGISSSLSKNDELECKNQIQLSINSSKIYFSLNDNTNCVNINTLIDEEYLENKKIDKLNKEYEICITDKGYTYNGKILKEATCK